jgi:hypothetical protein
MYIEVKGMCGPFYSKKSNITLYSYTHEEF